MEDDGRPMRVVKDYKRPVGWVGWVGSGFGGLGGGWLGGWVVRSRTGNRDQETCPWALGI